MIIKLSKLSHHPLNQRIYSLSGIEKLMSSIEQVGLLEPPTIDQHFQVISGNRRFESVKRLGRRVGSSYTPEQFLERKKSKDILQYLNKGTHTYKDISKILGVSQTTISKVKKMSQMVKEPTVKVKKTREDLQMVHS